MKPPADAYLLAFDPGAHTAAWASFADGRLVRCGFERETKDSTLAQALDVQFGCAAIARAVIETPQAYGRRGKEDPNDLVAVAVTVGRIAQALGPRFAPEFVRPHAWKGSVPKRVMNDRTTKRLDNDELEQLYKLKIQASLRHNVIDAIGLGLWALGRL